MTPSDAAATPRRTIVAAIGAAIFLLCACHRTPAAAEPKAIDIKETKAANAKPAEVKAEGEGVTLALQQVEKLGIIAEAAKAADYKAETAGYGVVLPHDTIAAAVAELTTAELTEKQTHAALARARSLNGTPGALSAEVEETANRQAGADTAAETLAGQRLSGILGLNPPWKSTERPALLQDLASGKSKLLRATFPLGTLHGPAPKSLRAAHLDALQSTTPQAALGRKFTSVWDAPADASVPGRSVFAILKGSDFVEGERLLVWAPGPGPAQAGVLIPAAAVIISGGKYWCYVEEQPGNYRRVEVDTDRPLEGGYFVAQGVEVGVKVVTAAAGLLLARESNAHTDAD